MLGNFLSGKEFYFQYQNVWNNAAAFEYPAFTISPLGILGNTTTLINLLGWKTLGEL